CIAELENMDKPQNYVMSNNQFVIELNTANTGTTSGGTRFNARKNSSTDIQNSTSVTILNDNNNPAHISIWRQKERVRVYVNDQKIWDIPKATLKEAKFNSIVFSVIYAEEVVKHYITNLRLAVGAPDTRKKMLEQNKWVTHGILFDVNSANIKPESYGTLKEMANVLKEYADLKVKIVGHTDADGADAANLDLSKRRAASVKSALAKEFGIEESRMETDGKGESEPIDKNDNPAGKANNRRVEFIKL
ncbi:MAG TPA: OmpA family protein, partial [Chitinophagaceae bacterium]|nr:OmpA family protein [Chitinophagaceae bacterium]